MPKVSDAHLAARREQILEAAMACFAARGFQATSIADIIEASGMSAGAVYRYYASKGDLIEAIVHRVLGQTAARFDELLDHSAATDPAEAVRVAVGTIQEIGSTGPVEVTRLAVQAWGEALHNDQVHDLVREAYTTIRAYFEEVARRASAAGTLPADADPRKVATALLSLVVGFMLQSATLGDVDAASYGDGVTVLLG